MKWNSVRGVQNDSLIADTTGELPRFYKARGAVDPRRDCVSGLTGWVDRTAGRRVTPDPGRAPAELPSQDLIPTAFGFGLLVTFEWRQIQTKGDRADGWALSARSVLSKPLSGRASGQFNAALAMSDRAELLKSLRLLPPKS